MFWTEVIGRRGEMSTYYQAPEVEMIPIEPNNALISLDMTDSGFGDEWDLSQYS